MGVTSLFSFYFQAVWMLTPGRLLFALVVLNAFLAFAVSGTSNPLACAFYCVRQLYHLWLTILHWQAYCQRHYLVLNSTREIINSERDAKLGFLILVTIGLGINGRFSVFLNNSLEHPIKDQQIQPFRNGLPGCQLRSPIGNDLALGKCLGRQLHRDSYPPGQALAQGKTAHAQAHAP